MTRLNNKMHRKLRRTQAGQALVEFALYGLAMLTLVFGLIDFCRAVYQKQVIANVSREGSNLASRGTKISDALTAVMAGSGSLNLNKNGHVIITAIFNDGKSCKITQQQSQGSLSASSKVGNLGDSLPCNASASSLPQPNQSLYVTEVFYGYGPVTPVGNLLGIVLPTPLYDVAYF